MIGTELGSYRITKEIGAGGMGQVFLAEHKLMGKQVAVKVLRKSYSGLADVVQRFFNEAKSASMIKHPGIIDIYDFGNDQGFAYIIMEHLKGDDLGARIDRQGKLDEVMAAGITQQMADALAAAHAANVVHRDLKPDNVILVPDSSAPGGERPKILDFGIAKLLDIPADQGLTQAGMIMGTPEFMSPEQADGSGKVDYRADIYSLGCMLFHMLTGRPPFVKGQGNVIVAHLTTEAPRVSSLVPGVHATLDNLVAHMLVKEKEGRPQSMEEVSSILATVSGAHSLRPGLNVGDVTGSLSAAPAGPASVGPASVNNSVPSAGGGAVLSPGASGSISPSVLSGGAVTHGGAGHPVSPTTLGGSVGGGVGPQVTHQIRPIKKPSKAKKFIAPALAIGAGLAVALFAKSALQGKGDKDKAPVSAKAGGDEGSTEGSTGDTEPKTDPPKVDENKVDENKSKVDPSSGDGQSGDDKTETKAGQDEGEDKGDKAVAKVFISIESMPSGAEVIRASDHEVLGVTPFHKEFPKGDEELDLVLDHDGYHKMEVTVGLDKDSSKRWTLKKRSSRSERKKSLFD